MIPGRIDYKPYGRTSNKAHGRNAHLSGGPSSTRRAGRDHCPRGSVVREAVAGGAGTHPGSISAERGISRPARRSSAGLGGCLGQNGVSRSATLARIPEEHRHGLCRHSAESQSESGVGAPARLLRRRVLKFKDHFSDRAALYATCRPLYPDSLFAQLAGLTREHRAAVDCGTGNGQAALGLTKHFRRVIATDPSEAQISSRHSARAHSSTQSRARSRSHFRTRRLTS